MPDAVRANVNVMPLIAGSGSIVEAAPPDMRSVKPPALILACGRMPPEGVSAVHRYDGVLRIHPCVVSAATSRIDVWRGPFLHAIGMCVSKPMDGDRITETNCVRQPVSYYSQCKASEGAMRAA